MIHKKYEQLNEEVHKQCKIWVSVALFIFFCYVKGEISTLIMKLLTTVSPSSHQTLPGQSID